MVWPRTDVEMDAIASFLKAAWTFGTDQNEDVLDDTLVAELTGLLDLDRWTWEILAGGSGPGGAAASSVSEVGPPEREKQLGKRYQLIATNTPRGQVAWLDARHRSHVHVENDVKQAKSLGLSRWPSRHWAINVAWTQVVALAANLLAAFRHLALPAGELRDAAPKLLRFRFLHVPLAGPAVSGRWLHLRQDWPWTTDLTGAWHTVLGTARPDLTPAPPTRRQEKTRPERGTRRRRPTAGPQPCPQNGNLDQKAGLVIRGTNPATP